MNNRERQLGTKVFWYKDQAYIRKERGSYFVGQLDGKVFQSVPEEAVIVSAFDTPIFKVGVSTFRARGRSEDGWGSYLAVTGYSPTATLQTRVYGLPQLYDVHQRPLDAATADWELFYDVDYASIEEIYV